jgi:hydrogenase nickel incorporation protein HypA/HybF
MQCALDQALDEAQRAGLRIGALSGVVPEALQFAFEALSEGTPAAGAKLTIEPVPARFWCEHCRQEFPSARLIPECPVCGNHSRNLRAGRELELASLEVA